MAALKDGLSPIGLVSLVGKVYCPCLLAVLGDIWSRLGLCALKVPVLGKVWVSINGPSKACIVSATCELDPNEKSDLSVIDALRMVNALSREVEEVSTMTAQCQGNNGQNCCCSCGEERTGRSNEGRSEDREDSIGKLDGSEQRWVTLTKQDPFLY